MAKAKRVKEVEPTSSHPFDLIAITDFGDFKRGERITDGEIITKLLRENTHDVTKVTKSL